MEVLSAGRGRRVGIDGRPVAMPREDPIAVYLTELRARLGGSWRRRRRIVSEVRTHLLEAWAADPLAGHDSAGAAQRAIERFGTVEQTAQAFAGENDEMRVHARTRASRALAAAMVLCAAALSAALVLALGEHSAQPPHANDSRNPQARQVEPMRRQLLASERARRRLTQGGVVAVTGNRLKLERAFGAMRMCDPRLRINPGTVSGRAPTVRVVLAGGRVLTVPVYRMPDDATLGAGSVILLRRPAIEQAVRVQALMADARMFASAPPVGVPGCVARTAISESRG